MKRIFEVELRGLLTAEEHAALTTRLTNDGFASEADDKDTFFFDFSGGILKVCDDVSKGQAKISLKIGEEASGALEELEVPIRREAVPAALQLFGGLGYGTPHHVRQKRTNYFLGTATLSLKYTPDFHHHFELEGRLLDDPAQIEPEKQRLREMCVRYGLTPLEPHEIARRVKAIKRRLGFGR